MGNPAGVRRDFEALDKRRFQAIRLLDKGLNQSEIARRVKVVRQTVARWVSAYRQPFNYPQVPGNWGGVRG
jgi:transposase